MATRTYASGNRTFEITLSGTPVAARTPAGSDSSWTVEHLRTARADDGVWCVLEGPPEIATALNTIADDPPAGVHVDEQRLREARGMYPDVQVLPRPPADGHMIH